MTDWLLDQVFDFNGRQVRYAVRGDGPPLVFVHGTPFSSYVWHRIAPHFFATHRVHSVSHHTSRLCRPLREQARSHKGSASSRATTANHQPVGAGLLAKTSSASPSQTESLPHWAWVYSVHRFRANPRDWSIHNPRPLTFGTTTATLPRVFPTPARTAP